MSMCTSLFGLDGVCTFSFCLLWLNISTCLLNTAALNLALKTRQTAFNSVQLAEENISLTCTTHDLLYNTEALTTTLLQFPLKQLSFYFEELCIFSVSYYVLLGNDLALSCPQTKLKGLYLISSFISTEHQGGTGLEMNRFPMRGQLFFFLLLVSPHISDREAVTFLACKVCRLTIWPQHYHIFTLPGSAVRWRLLKQ